MQWARLLLLRRPRRRFTALVSAHALTCSKHRRKLHSSLTVAAHGTHVNAQPMHAGSRPEQRAPLPHDVTSPFVLAMRLFRPHAVLRLFSKRSCAPSASRQPHTPVARSVQLALREAEIVRLSREVAALKAIVRAEVGWSARAGWHGAMECARPLRSVLPCGVSRPLPYGSAPVPSSPPPSRPLLAPSLPTPSLLSRALTNCAPPPPLPPPPHFLPTPRRAPEGSDVRR